MARTVKDAAYVLAAIAGKDSNDNYTSAIPFNKIPDYVGACKKDGLRGQRIGIPRNFFYLDETTTAALNAFDQTIDTVRKAGATIVDNTDYARLDEFFQDASFGAVLGANFKTNLAEYLAQLTKNPRNVKTLEDVTEFTKNDRREEFPDRDVGVFEEALGLGYGNTDPRAWEALQTSISFAKTLTDVLDQYNLDAIMLPTAFANPFPAILGTPIITVPMGFMPQDQEPVTTPRGLTVAAPNVPFGLSFLGRAFSEEILIGHAYAYEQRTNIREKGKPFKVPKTDLKDIVKTK